MKESIKPQDTSWWITSIAVSVVCCSVLFILFASYLVELKSDIRDANTRISAIETRGRMMAHYITTRPNVSSDTAEPVAVSSPDSETTDMPAATETSTATTPMATTPAATPPTSATMPDVSAPTPTVPAFNAPATPAAPVASPQAGTPPTITPPSVMVPPASPATPAPATNLPASTAPASSTPVK